MKFSVDWIREYVELPDDLGEISDRLTAGGLAVEGTERVGEDSVLDIDVTTNRPDTMCHFGLARELAVLFDQPLEPPPARPPESSEAVEDVVRVTLEDDDCPRYAVRVVRGIAVGPSPRWLARRLEVLGHRPHNNVVDVTNYVLWETGQPIHAFDLDRVSEGHIIVRSALGGERLVTLDEEDRELDPEVLVIADPEGAIALAGIMGGRDSEVSETTRNVLIESAHFRPQRVRRGAGVLGMHTDASHRFERGADPEACCLAADRVAYLLSEVAGGVASKGTLDARRGEVPVLFGAIDPAALSRFAGVEIGPEKVERSLEGLGFAPRSRDGGGFEVTVPSWRHYDFVDGRERDARGVRVWEADLYEEVLRIVGFDSVPAALPALGAPDPGASSEHELRERIRVHLSACGLAEAINYSFHDEASHQRFAGLVGEGAAVRLSNPLSEALAVLRRSLLPGLVASGRYNSRRGASSIALFEIGRLFPSEGGEEVEAVGIVAGGSSDHPWERDHPMDLFDVKGYFESLAHRFGIELEVAAAEVPGLLPGTSFEWHLAGDRVGYLGQLADDDFPFPVFAGELATAALEASGKGDDPLRVELPSRFPGVSVDLTLTHSSSVRFADLGAAIDEQRPPDLVDFGLKDRYQGKGVPEGAVNTTMFFLYNAQDRSLTRDEVNASHERLRGELEARFGWRE